MARSVSSWTCNTLVAASSIKFMTKLKSIIIRIYIIIIIIIMFLSSDFEYTVLLDELWTENF